MLLVLFRFVKVSLLFRFIEFDLSIFDNCFVILIKFYHGISLDVCAFMLVGFMERLKLSSLIVYDLLKVLNHFFHVDDHLCSI